jgi:hypothetical protein
LFFQITVGKNVWTGSGLETEFEEWRLEKAELLLQVKDTCSAASQEEGKEDKTKMLEKSLSSSADQMEGLEVRLQRGLDHMNVMSTILGERISEVGDQVKQKNI